GGSRTDGASGDRGTVRFHQRRDTATNASGDQGDGQCTDRQSPCAGTFPRGLRRLRTWHGRRLGGATIRVVRAAVGLLLRGIAPVVGLLRSTGSLGVGVARRHAVIRARPMTGRRRRRIPRMIRHCWSVLFPRVVCDVVLTSRTNAASRQCPSGLRIHLENVRHIPRLCIDLPPESPILGAPVGPVHRSRRACRGRPAG
ncbi:MAG: hypothetical protein QOI28_312, partial [Mycobacterium sp.]|nr:hypothetical protein [Mycobacterium sp.]